MPLNKVLMELILWLGINALIGYALGKPKNEVGASILICILLGPIGWLLCILNKGKLRKCPYCAEDVKPEAVVCRHCGRELPQTPSRAPVPRQISPKRRKREIIATLLVVLVLLGGLGLYAAMHKASIPTKPVALHSNATQSASHSPLPPPEATNPPLPTIAVLKSTVTLSTGNGIDTKPPGTQFRIISRDNSTVHVYYAGSEHVIPISAVELK